MKDLYFELFEILEESELEGQICLKKGEKSETLKFFIQKRNDNNFYHEFFRDDSDKKNNDYLDKLKEFVRIKY